MSGSKNDPAATSRGNFTPPSDTATSPADRPAPAAPSPAGSRLRPRNWRVPTKLYAILLIPVVVGLVMGGFQVKGSVDTWQEAKDAERTARLVRAALTYSQRLVDERDISAAPLLRGDRKAPEVARARAATDRAAAAFDAATRDMPHTAGLERRLAAFRKTEPRLTKLRAAAYTSELDGVRTEEGYVAVQHPLMEFANELGLGTGNITSYGRTVYSISLTKAAVSLERSIGMHLLVKPGPKPSDLGRQRVALSSYAYLEGIATEEYRSGGTPQDAAALAQARTQLQADTEQAAEERAKAAKAAGETVVPAPPLEKMVDGLAALPGTGSADRKALARQGITEQSWWDANTAKFDAYRTIEANLADKAVNEAAGVADDARRATFITGAAVLVALLAALVLAGLMARQMSRSMRSLRTAAFDIAQQRLPMIVDQLSRTAPGRVDTRVRPLPITTTDEIGEVARAFDQVHREAVRLAAEQAMLRGNVNAIFANLSRRNEMLIEGQLSLITNLESRETDPDQLATLFRLDHLATRMRRNGENLLVLSGKEPSRTWGRPVPLVDVLRAAASEVEQYHRIQLVGVPEADIHGLAVTDLMHLLAELLENAAVFSSPDTRVRVTATRLPDGRVMIEIHDQGIGLTPEDFADVNHKLANPPAVDASLSQRMGLFVVGRLADRHGVRVQLRPSSEHAGTTALVMLPDRITHGGGAGAEQEPEFTVSSIIPERQADLSAPLRTAAELGFDDSRYADSGAAPDLDPVSRSLRRSERQAAETGGPVPGGPEPATPMHQDAYQDSGPDAEPHVTPPLAAQQAASTDPGAAPHAAPGAWNGSYHARYTHAPEDPQQGAYNGAYAPYDAAGVTGASNTPGDALDGAGAGVQGGATEEVRHLPGHLPSGANGSGPPQPGYTEATEADHWATAQGHTNGYEPSPHQGEWAHQGSFQAAYPINYGNEAESSAVTDGNSQDRVGFTPSGPAPSTTREVTDAGLPLRGSRGSGGQGISGAAAGPRHAGRQAPAGTTGGPQSGQDVGRSANDEHRQRAEALRTPRAGGVTPSGLPRRTPRANLVSGSAAQTPQGGPQVSRAPEDVRGRLSSLRRGIQRGHSEGSNSKGRSGQGPHSGPIGPDSTYNQER
ncbi:sensor histidine kinase [Streptomyces odontomachi]|uniref:sensor histidine kinase n=1 Tax=Streptomyces odontomachi TaxID=2944940 RepID=UPI00210EFCA4|nr:nitrate- and nitrite sensing domain-containing protein [Streptomyces sp. ODS25]